MHANTIIQALLILDDYNSHLVHYIFDTDRKTTNISTLVCRLTKKN